MSFVKKVSEQQAGPELRPLYQQIRQLYGFLPNYFQALGPLPKVIERDLELLRRLGIEKSLGRKLAIDYPSAPVGNKEMALFRFAEKLTRNPSAVEKADADAVFQAGWDEAALIETVLTVALSNFVNRVAFGLGLFADF